MSEYMLKLATRRKTARAFAKTPVDFENIIYSIRVAVQAPSGANRQPWSFIVVDDAEMKEKVRAACEEQEKRFHASVKADLKQWFKSKNITWEKPFLTDAPILLAVFSDRRMPYARESTWLAVGYIILALEERSLSTVTYTPSYTEKVRSVFQAPDECRLETILPIGYSADTKPKEERRRAESFMHRNVWGARF